MMFLQEARWPMGHAIGRAAFGAAVFNYSTLHQWPFVLTLADVAWGAESAACAAAVRVLVR